ncbi:cache domain-containing protein [Arthrobacter sp. 18067]|uniref:cache domain-containing protein n=1 Tax=Arthrobacter sp. 18067 TaxID=2681413 RepID=UPI001359BF31|nr:cache domain-containing protein [Arthrobacter sp. 18067]
MKLDNEVVHAAHALALWTSDVLAEINHLAGHVAELVEKNLAGRPKVDESSLLGLEALSREFLAKNSFAVGAGTFFAAQSVEAEGHIFEWWSHGKSGSSSIEKLDADLTPGSHRYYDYEKLPFFSTAASTGEQTLWGPYIDYLGFDEYIITLTAPFSIHGTFAGVAGCDILVKDLEPLIMPHLRAIPGNAAMVNASNRVIMGNSGTYLVGERIKPGYPEDQQRIDLDVPHLGLSLVYSA